MSALPADRRPSYAVIWRSGDGAPSSGSLVLGAHALYLSGAGAPQGLVVPFGDVVSASIGRRPEDQIGGRPSLVLERLNGERLLACAFGSVGALTELFELVSAVVRAGPA